MYIGPGAGPMTAAALAWDAVATELFTAAVGYGSVLTELTDAWRGPTSLSMASAATPFVVWLHATATVAEQTAIAAKAAAAAYELAFAMTVPPPVIAANRSLLLALITTNFFGQNTPAIAATEAHYAQMWIQDATAMYGYAGSSAAASHLTRFTGPRPTTSLNGLAAQSGAAGHTANNAAAPPTPPTQSPTWVDYLEHVPNVVNTVMSNSSAAVSRSGIVITNARLAFQDAQAGVTGRLTSADSTPGYRVTVSAAMGRAVPLAGVSVPAGWITAAPDIATSSSSAMSVATATGTATGTAPVPGSVFSQAALGTLSGNRSDEPRPKSKPVIVRSPAAG